MSELILHDIVDSTNDEARRLAEQGAESGTAVVARAQRAGRGRRGRQWHSPDAGNLYLSLIHRTTLAPSDGLTGITLDAGIAVADVLTATGLEVGLKWPNDIFVDGRKLGGILTELVIDGDKVVVIVGLGLNVNATVDDFPADLHPIATSVRIESGVAQDLDWLGDRIARALRAKLAAFEVRGAPDVRGFESRCVLMGETIEYEGQGSERASGVVVGLGDDGALKVRAGEGSEGELLIHAGEVQILTQDERL